MTTLNNSGDEGVSMDILVGKNTDMELGIK